MAQMRLWWPGLVAVAVLWLVAIWFKTAPVEQDLASRVGLALQSVPLDRPQISTRGRDVRLSGDAFTDDGRAQARTTADDIWGVRRVRDGLALVPEAKPFSWSATRDGGKIVLAGVSPLPATRLKLNVAAQNLPGAVGADETTYARGAPTSFEEMALLGLAQLGRLSNGKITITGNDVSIAGTAVDAAARDAIAAALGKLPSGFRLVENSVKAPPYVFSAVKDPKNGTLTLTGNVSDESLRKSLLADASKSFFGERVIDQLKVVPGAPEGFAAAASGLLAQLARLNAGEGVVSNGDVSLKGDALYPRAAEQIKAALIGLLPQGYKADASLGVAPLEAVTDAAGCQQVFNALLAKGNIYFETGQAAIDKISAGIIDRLAAVALRCPNANLEVSGHTDATGSDEINNDLSRRRAQAVTERLLAAGLDAAHLSAAGYGSTQPIASNDTEEGRAKNRRIEFRVKQAN